jgi:hypothetical protein
VSLLQAALEPSTLVLAVDPGKVSNRVWLSDGSGLLVDPMSMPVSRDGLAGVERLVSLHDAGHPGLVAAIEATGSLHRPWSSALERRYPGAVRLFAPSQTKAARTQLGSGRFKTDDCDCAARPIWPGRAPVGAGSMRSRSTRSVTRTRRCSRRSQSAACSLRSLRPRRPHHAEDGHGAARRHAGVGLARASPPSRSEPAATHDRGARIGRASGAGTEGASYCGEGPVLRRSPELRRSS